VVLVVAKLKFQETLQQDLETWLRLMEVDAPARFYPDWEVLPHENKLPHADAISERLETLQTLAGETASVITATVASLMQCTLPPTEIAHRTRTLRLGDRLDPLDFIEWLEAQGYEPEAQVTARGEISLRGGIVDVFPFTTPWPVRCEFFGNELESLRYFNPLSQVSREKIDSATFAPGGEMGLLRHLKDSPRATLLDHLPDNAILLFCDPDALTEAAAEKVMEIPPGDAFHVEWTTLLARMDDRNMSCVELHELVIELADVDQVEATVPAIRAALKTSHAKEDYEIIVPLELLRQAEETKRIFNIVLGSIAGISLIVGGIGIMNIMLATVTERTREIGIRRALGAQKGQIITQFLVETIVLSIAGGLVGVVLGVALPFAVEHFADMKTIVTLPAVLLAFGISAVVGVVFGVYPARRAANLDPIEALRH